METSRVFQKALNPSAESKVPGLGESQEQVTQDFCAPQRPVVVFL